MKDPFEKLNDEEKSALAWAAAKQMEGDERAQAELAARPDEEEKAFYRRVYVREESRRLASKPMNLVRVINQYRESRENEPEEGFTSGRAVEDKGGWVR